LVPPRYWEIRDELWGNHGATWADFDDKKYRQKNAMPVRRILARNQENIAPSIEALRTFLEVLADGCHQTCVPVIELRSEPIEPVRAPKPFLIPPLPMRKYPPSKALMPL
jgi:hypothetical protein